jgi:hypothetical protein
MGRPEDNPDGGPLQWAADQDGSETPRALLAFVAEVLALPDVREKFDEAGVGAFLHLTMGRGGWVEIERVSERRAVIRLVSHKQVVDRLLENGALEDGGVN